jgi:lambda family phage portal protein
VARRQQTLDGKNTAEAFEGLKADYAAARDSRFERRRIGLPGDGSAADYHLRAPSNYWRMMEKARDADRNDAVIGQLIDRAADNTVHDGITLDVQTGDEKLDKELAERWFEWSDDPDLCDVQGEHDFSQLARFAFRHTLVDGDCTALPSTEGAIQLNEGHRLRTPQNTTRNVVLGVLLDELRRRQEYWFTRDEIDPLRSVARVSDMRRVPVRDEEGYRQVFHVYNPKRVTQTRGVTALAPIFPTAGMFEDINFAKLVQQQVSSCFAIFRKRELDFQKSSSTDPLQKGEQETQTLSDGSRRLMEGIAPGMEVIGEPGEELTGFSPSVPNAEFFQHVELMLSIIGANLGLPLMMIFMDSTKTNFSGWRGASEQAKFGFRRNQRELVKRFHRPVYQWKLRQWLAEDSVLRAALNEVGRRAFFNHVWKPPGWRYIDPYKDAQADALAIDKVLKSPRQVSATNGGDFQETATELVQDHVYLLTELLTAAKALNQKFPEAGITWRDVKNPSAEQKAPAVGPGAGSQEPGARRKPGKPAPGDEQDADEEPAADEPTDDEPTADEEDEA